MDLQAITDEAVRIARDYPELTYKEAIEKAKEMLINETLRTKGNVSECMELN